MKRQGGSPLLLEKKKPNYLFSYPPNNFFHFLKENYLGREGKGWGELERKGNIQMKLRKLGGTRVKMEDNDTF